MDSSIQATIDKINAQIRSLEEQVSLKKEMVNNLCEMEGAPRLYSDIKKRNGSSGMPSFRPDQFYGRPLATAVKEILEQRASANLGAVSLNELFDTLKSGGFSFDNANDQIARRNVSITLAKNPAFAKVPHNGHIGLAEWYPNARRAKKEGGKSSAEDISEELGSDEEKDSVGDSPEEPVVQNT